jgi:hypothetical protein
MERFRATSKQETVPHIKSALSWDDVLLVAKNAVTNYEGKAQSGATGFFRRLGRGFGENAPTVKAVLTLIPKNDYTEPLLSVFDS